MAKHPPTYVSVIDGNTNSLDFLNPLHLVRAVFVAKRPWIDGFSMIYKPTSYFWEVAPWWFGKPIRTAKTLGGPRAHGWSNPLLFYHQATFKMDPVWFSTKKRVGIDIPNSWVTWNLGTFTKPWLNHGFWGHLMFWEGLHAKQPQAFTARHFEFDDRTCNPSVGS